MDRRLIASAISAFVLCACTRPPTTVVVVVESDLRVPDELASVAVQAGGAECVHEGCAHTFPLTDAASLPFSFSVVPAGDPSGPLTLSVRGLDGSGAERVAREVSTRFVAERTRVLHVTLTRSCLDHAACATGETCIAGACTSAVVDPSTLTELVPGTELDGSTIPEAGTIADAGDAGTIADAGDAGTIADSGARDAGDDASRDAANDADHDAGTAPASCADLPGGSASGAYEIDPDGPGGVAPFLDYCETEADGGGWTLIAKVDPDSPTLAYSMMPWVGTATMAFGTADLTVANALYPSYWALPVRELRFVAAPRATPTQTRTLVTRWSPAGTTTLRDAMDPGHHPRLDAPRSAWLTWIGARSDPGAAVCESVGAPAALPEAAPVVRVRIGYVWADGDCSAPALWAGLGAEGTSCRPVASTAGGGRICGTGAQREDLPLAVWLFGR